MKWLVFSKDRAYQLDAFLNTAKNNAKIQLENISVLYHYTDYHKSDIEKLKQEYPAVNFIEEKNFKNDVMNWLENIDDQIISFATDDAIFTREVHSETIKELLLANQHVITFSLRMGLHLERCYPTNSAQKVPNGKIQSGVFIWSCKDAEGDWSYPLSVDGHVFRKDFVINMLKQIDFRNPNTLESNWQMILPYIPLQIVCCGIKSSYFNVPLNKVQNIYNNRSGNVTVEFLMNEYRSGKRFNSKIALNFLNESAHQELDI